MEAVPSAAKASRRSWRVIFIEPPKYGSQASQRFSRGGAGHDAVRGQGLLKLLHGARQLGALAGPAHQLPVAA